MLLNAESFNSIKKYFFLNNEELQLKDFIVAIMENFHGYSSKVGLVKTLMELYKDIDIDGNGLLEFKEFLQYLIDF